MVLDIPNFIVPVLKTFVRLVLKGKYIIIHQINLLYFLYGTL